MNPDSRIDRLANKHKNLKRETIARAKVIHAELLSLDDKQNMILLQLGVIEDNQRSIMSIQNKLKDCLIAIFMLLLINFIALVVFHG